MPLTLEKSLQIRSPLNWVVTEEPHRVINLVCKSAVDRPVFRMDLMDGLLIWDHDKQEWLKELIEIEPGTWEPTAKMEVGLFHALKQRGVFIMENAHLQAEALVGFFGYTARKWLDAFYVDDADKYPAQFVLISYKDEVPGEIARDVSKVRLPLPAADQLIEIAVHTHEKGALPALAPNVLVKLGRAGLGMTELEFVQACMTSLTKTGDVSPEVVSAIKLERIKDGGILQVGMPTIKMADIGGLDQAKRLLARAVWAWNNADVAKANHIDPLRRILLVGVPGSGKSAICEAAADALGLELAKFGTTQVMSKWVGESERQMREAFAQIAAMKPVAMWIDEFGRDMSGSGQQGDSGTTDRVHGEFLTGIQELPKEVFLVAAANRIDNLPPEMLRADRFDKVMFIGFPTAEEREDIFRIHLGDQADDFDLPALAHATPFFTGAEIKAMIKEVRDITVPEEQRPINTRDLIEFAPRMKGRVWVNHKPAIIEMYKRAKTEWDWASSAQEAEADAVLSERSKLHQGAGPAGPRLEKAPAEGNIFGSPIARR